MEKVEETAATWSRLPAELITKIGNYSNLGTKLNLSACARTEFSAVSKSTMQIDELKIEFLYRRIEMSLREENGLTWKSSFERKTYDPYEKSYHDMLDVMHNALKFSKTPIKNFVFDGGSEEYLDLMCFRKLIPTDTLHFTCNHDQHWLKWLRRLFRKDLVCLKVRSTQDHGVFRFFPEMQHLRRLHLIGFTYMDFDDIHTIPNMELIVIQGSHMIKNLGKFLKKWCDSELIKDNRWSLHILGAENFNWITVKYQLRKEIREVYNSEDEETSLLRRKRDGAVADIEIGGNWLKFNYTPNKYQRIFNWEPFDVVEEERPPRLLAGDEELDEEGDGFRMLNVPVRRIYKE